MQFSSSPFEPSEEQEALLQSLPPAIILCSKTGLEEDFAKLLADCAPADILPLSCMASISDAIISLYFGGDPQGSLDDISGDTVERMSSAFLNAVKEVYGADGIGLLATRRAVDEGWPTTAFFDVPDPATVAQIRSQMSDSLTVWLYKDDDSLFLESETLGIKVHDGMTHKEIFEAFLAALSEVRK